MERGAALARSTRRCVISRASPRVKRGLRTILATVLHGVLFGRTCSSSACSFVSVAAALSRYPPPFTPRHSTQCSKHQVQRRCTITSAVSPIHDRCAGYLDHRCDVVAGRILLISLALPVVWIQFHLASLHPG